MLYNHGDGDEGATKYRARTFVPTGPEMDTVRRNKHIVGNKSEDAQLSNSPSSVGTPTINKNSGGNTKPEALSSSLLKSESSSVYLPYDLSLMDVDLSNYQKKAVPPANEAGKR